MLGAIGVVAAACSSSSDSKSANSTTVPATGSSSTSSAVSASSSTSVVPDVELPDEPFTLGVASGDVTGEAAILWTRLVPDPSVGDGAMPDEEVSVIWQVALHESFDPVVAEGVETASAKYAHSVHADATGLEASTDYVYRFSVGDWTSEVGRFRTLPADGTEPFSFVVATCQDPQFGQYSAWREIAERDDSAAVVFTGDYIYELPPIDASPDKTAERVWTTTPPVDLEGFRLRYAEVKSDVHLQAAHAASGWFVMWDDHEITDNYYKDDGGQLDLAGGDFKAKRVAAYQAWWEHQPVRLDPPVDGALDVYRSVRIGDLAELFMIDTRQYADEPPCRDASRFDFGACDDRDAERTLLGDQQEEWLLDGLSDASTTWTTLVSPVMFAGLDARVEGDSEAGYYLEGWDGYTQARDRVADALATTSNPVVLSGDYHASFALDVGPAFGRDVIAPEFMATAISSSPFAAEVRPANPHVHHFAGDNGYLHCTVTEDDFNVEYRSVDDIWDPSSGLTTTARFAIDSGDPNMREVS